MKKSLFVSLTSFLVIMLLALCLQYLSGDIITTVRGGPQTVVRVEPATSHANLSSTFVVNVTIIDVQNLYAVDVTLNWNSSVLNTTNIDIRLGQPDGVLNGPPFIARNQSLSGSYSLAATAVGPAAPFYGNGTVVSITFQVINLGSSPLSLQSQLSDYGYPNPSSPIDHSTISGSFDTTIPEIPNVLLVIMFFTLSALAAVLSWTHLKKRESGSELEKPEEQGGNHHGLHTHETVWMMS